MNKILVLSPHVDDDLYGCLGYILKMAKNNEVTVAYCTASQEQFERYCVIDDIYSEYGVKTERLSLFEDGQGDMTPTKNIARVFDKLILGYDTILVNSYSNHQDHNKIRDALGVSLRTRPDLSVNTVLEYDYCYNQLSIDQKGCCTYYFDEEVQEQVFDVWRRFDHRHKVTKSDPNHVTNPHQALKLNEFLASYRGMPYAERFHILKMDIFSKEW